MGDDIHIRTIEKVKKNLVLSFIMLLIALVAVSGVTFAYFSSSQNGATNTVTIGEFDFLTSGVKTESGYYKIKAPTIINAPTAIEKPTLSVPSQNPGESDSDYQTRKAQYMTDYNAKLTAYLTDGDDEFFNNCVIPITVTVTNNSLADMSLKIELSAVSDAGANYASCFEYFVFKTTPLAYDTQIRTDCAGIASTKPIIYEKTKDVLSSGRVKFNDGLKRIPLYAKNKNANGALNGAGIADTPHTATYYAICWLDYRGYKTILGQTRPVGNVKISAKVTASQYIVAP